MTAAEAARLRVYDHVPGGRRGAGADLYLASERVIVRELIRQRVEAEVAAYNAKPATVFAGLIQPTQSEQVLNGYRLERKRPLDAEAQVQVAWQQFEKRGFILLFDDRQVESLDEMLTLTGDNTTVFLRLVPLVGG
jgi:hypothetical protein